MIMHPSMHQGMKYINLRFQIIMVKNSRRVPSFADAEDDNNDINSGFVSADVRQRLVHSVSVLHEDFHFFCNLKRSFRRFHRMLTVSTTF